MIFLQMPQSQATDEGELAGSNSVKWNDLPVGGGDENIGMFEAVATPLELILMFFTSCKSLRPRYAAPTCFSFRELSPVRCLFRLSPAPPDRLDALINYNCTSCTSSGSGVTYGREHGVATTAWIGPVVHICCVMRR